MRENYKEKGKFKKAEKYKKGWKLQKSPPPLVFLLGCESLVVSAQLSKVESIFLSIYSSEQERKKAAGLHIIRKGKRFQKGNNTSLHVGWGNGTRSPDNPTSITLHCMKNILCLFSFKSWNVDNAQQDCLFRLSGKLGCWSSMGTAISSCLLYTCMHMYPTLTFIQLLTFYLRLSPLFTLLSSFPTLYVLTTWNLIIFPPTILFPFFLWVLS